MGRRVAIAFCLAVFTANVIEGASLAGPLSYDDEDISDVTSVIVGGDDGEGLTDIPVDLLGGVTGGDGDLDSTVGSILGGVSGEDEGLDSTIGSVLGSDDLTDSFIDDTVEDILGGLTGDEDLDSTLESILGVLTEDGDLDSTLESILVEVTGDGDLDSTVESIFGGVTGDGDLDSTGDSILGGDVLTDLTKGEVLGEVTVEDEDEGTTVDSLSGVTDKVEDLVSTIDMVLEGVQDGSSDFLLGAVTDTVGDVVGAVESVEETMITSGGRGDIAEAINPSGSVIEGTTNTETDAAANSAEGTTSCVLSDPRAVKVLVPVLRKLMTDKSTLGMLVKLAVVGRLKKAEQNC